MPTHNEIQSAQRAAQRRDYALLALAVSTGRRLSELARLCWDDFTITAESITVTWQRTKGGKTMRDILPASVGKALVDYQHSYFTAVGTLPATSAQVWPVWVAFARNTTAFHQLSIKALERICQKWLGTAKFHSLRHTFAHQMEDAGAKVSDIQARLGHGSISTTGEYLVAMRSDENPFSADIAAQFGNYDSSRPSVSKPEGRVGGNEVALRLTLPSFPCT